jgi:predicted nuclease of predicted toxin-antitoxin system
MQQGSHEAEIMSSSQSPPELKFLLDENVHSRLGSFLKASGYNVLVASKGSSDRIIAELSLAQKRVLVTNDSDFESKTPQEVFSVILLRMPQTDASMLLKAFATLLTQKKSPKQFSGKLTVMKADGFKTTLLPKKEQ